MKQHPSKNTFEVRRLISTLWHTDSQSCLPECIVYTWDHRTSGVIWSILKVQPILSDEVQTFKALIMVHKIIKDGHPTVSTIVARTGLSPDTVSADPLLHMKTEHALILVIGDQRRITRNWMVRDMCKKCSCWWCTWIWSSYSQLCRSLITQVTLSSWSSWIQWHVWLWRIYQSQKHWRS